MGGTGFSIELNFLEYVVIGGSVVVGYVGVGSSGGSIFSLL